MRDRIVQIARSWEKTPLKHQASVKGVGCDCKGFIWGVAREAGLPEADTWFAKVSDYSVRIPVDLLRDGLAACFDPADKPQLGDILLMKLGSPVKAQHLAIYVGDNRMIHASTGARCVLEVPMGKAWWTALDSIWSWRL